MCRCSCCFVFYIVTYCTFSFCRTFLVVGTPFVGCFSITVILDRDFLIGAIITVIAGVVCFPADCGAGCFLCFVMHEIMTIGRNHLCFYFSTSRAGICFLPRCCAGWRSSYYPAIPNVFPNIGRFCAGITLMPMIVFIRKPD